MFPIIHFTCQYLIKERFVTEQKTVHHQSKSWPNSMIYIWVIGPRYINTLRPRQDGRLFPDIFKSIFVNENVQIFIKISLTFVPKIQIDNNPLSEPMMVSLLTHICVTRPEWLKDVYWGIQLLCNYPFTDQKKSCRLLCCPTETFLQIIFTICIISVLIMIFDSRHSAAETFNSTLPRDISLVRVTLAW